ncbi:polyamine aminopropyltransferase [Psychrobium sp. MM17-31]|uniref:polyamine aminopropyltransferase n=1 Tax=Psychrobium sp. MM17-31 TaxID=2917758 RepID=UPI0023B79338|nr:polyamine aminopropyltransferase [Psychrobium sp. MM17-31]
MNSSVTPKPSARLFDDVLLITIMAVLAGCGLIYEYLLSHYAGRVIGAVESAIYTMIGIMIVSMGLGAFAARKVKCAFSGFAWLELTIALLGCSAILVISSAIAAVQLLPQIISETFNLPPDAEIRGGLFGVLHDITHYSPYFFGAVLGLFIGMEIPLIARIREFVHKQHLVHNAGTIYGADYIGAGIGAAIWITIMLSLEINLSASITASANLIAGVVFWLRYKEHIRFKYLLLVGHVLCAVLVAAIFSYGGQWAKSFNNLLYLDKVAYHQQTRYAQVVLTERQLPNHNYPMVSLYLNGRLQFAQDDEHIYHKFLVYPAMAASARHDNILIIGGGDGLGLRDVLAWSPKKVTLMDLDSEVVDLFKNPHNYLDDGLADNITRLNNNALNDERVRLIHADAYNGTDQLITDMERFDTIIVDLPDPSHPDLNKLYSRTFYLKLKQLLSNDGVMVVQSTSPFHAKKAFMSIAKTVKSAQFKDVEQYHFNVPSFGQWGWTIATQSGLSPRARLAQQKTLQPFETWLTPQLIQASFEFSQGFYQQMDEIKVNELGSFILYRYHQQAWESQQGNNNSWYQNE